MIHFYLNGQPHTLTHLNPNTTLLDYLRNHQGLTDAKEGCGSGDCGACTILAQKLPDDKSDPSPYFTLNACITLLSLMDGHHLMTASYLADNPSHHPKLASLHPAQQAMVDCHGSQCGFCTPGFVMSLACVYENNRLAQQQGDEQADQLSYEEVVASISGNLCRCTGYRPIIDAGLTMHQKAKQQNWVKDLSDRIASTVSAQAVGADLSLKCSESLEAAPALIDGDQQLFIPTSIEALHRLLRQYPNATLWAGGTDLGLSITQHLVDHETIIQLSAIETLQDWLVTNSSSSTSLGALSGEPIEQSDDSAASLVLGAAMSYQQLLPVLEKYFPTFAAVFERIASPQIRNMGTIGGNIANASPIGDLPPILLALEAQLHLRHCSDKAEGGYEDEIIPLSAFFIDYKKTQLRPGSYIVAIHIPLMTAHQQLFVHKVSKRYEDDISACLLAAKIEASPAGDQIADAKIGLGGMAAVPLLAHHCQLALTKKPATKASFEQAALCLSQDVSPMTDVRASREYRLHVVQRLLMKCGNQWLQSLSSEPA